jgi:crotonobetainyl-CoA:carnitine CoA-transferase CaiB-like acyl-CoA transferase
MTGGGLLDGVRVLDFGIWRPVPYATQLLADLGADVLKVEPPGGDPMRTFPGLFATINAHKRSIVLDLKDPAGLGRALDLAADAHVVTEGFRPGVADRLGIGPDAVRARNPAVVYLSLSGFGQTGPFRLVPGHDVNYQALAGVLRPDGGEPAPGHGVPWADVAGGLAAAFAICAALVRQVRHGDGEVIDLAMTDLLATWTGAVTPGPVASVGRRMSGAPGYGLYRARDGWISLGAITEAHFWAAICDGLGLTDVRGLTLGEQLDRADELRTRIADAVGALDRADAVARLAAAGAPVAPVNDRADMVADAHLRARDLVVDGPDGLPATAHPVRYAHHPARGPAEPPAADAHAGQGFDPAADPSGSR